MKGNIGVRLYAGKSYTGHSAWTVERGQLCLQSSNDWIGSSYLRQAVSSLSLCYAHTKLTHSISPQY